MAPPRVLKPQFSQFRSLTSLRLREESLVADVKSLQNAIHVVSGNTKAVPKDQLREALKRLQEQHEHADQSRHSTRTTTSILARADREVRPWTWPHTSLSNYPNRRRLVQLSEQYLEKDRELTALRREIELLLENIVMFDGGKGLDADDPPELPNRVIVDQFDHDQVNQPLDRSHNTPLLIDRPSPTESHAPRRPSQRPLAKPSSTKASLLRALHLKRSKSLESVHVPREDIGLVPKPLVPATPKEDLRSQPEGEVASSTGAVYGSATEDEVAELERQEREREYEERNVHPAFRKKSPFEEENQRYRELVRRLALKKISCEKSLEGGSQ